MTLTDVPADRIVSCGDLSCEFLVDPIPRPRPEPFVVTMTPAEPHITFVDNSKPNSMQILREAQRILRERGIEVTEEILYKSSASMPMSQRLLGQLREERGLLLMGVND